MTLPRSLWSDARRRAINIYSERDHFGWHLPEIIVKKMKIPEKVLAQSKELTELVSRTGCTLVGCVSHPESDCIHSFYCGLGGGVLKCLITLTMNVLEKVSEGGGVPVHKLYLDFDTAVRNALFADETDVR